MPAPNQNAIPVGNGPVHLNALNSVLTGKTDFVDGAIASAQFPAAIPHNALIADAALLRAYGAVFDGVTDDGPAFNAAITAAMQQGGGGKPSIVFQLPARTILIGTTILTGNINVSMQGTGAQNTILLMRSGAPGLWQHGSQAIPSTGYVQIDNVMMQDQNPSGSGCIALNFFFAGGIVPTVRFNQVRLLHFSQGIYLLNPPRDINAYALTVYGPDFAMQTAPGIVIESTQSGPEVFTTTWVACNVFNYAWGWRFIGGGMIEGHRFYGSTAYNGWGMVQAWVHGDGIVGLTGYQAVIWDFYCCDWQGFGYALDLRSCRGVRVRGGFYTFNDRTAQSGNTIAPPWGARTSAATNAMFSFSNCADVLIDGVQIDTSASGTYNDTVLMHADNGCTHVVVKNNAIFANSQLYGGFELGDPDASSVPYNTMKVLENEWLNWIKGDKVIDHAGKQIDLPWIEDNYFGTQTQAGMITIQQQVVATVQSATTNGAEIGQIYVALPKRRYGTNLFNGGSPTVVQTVQQALTRTQAAYYLGASDRAGFYLNVDKSEIGIQVTVNYIAMGL